MTTLDVTIEVSVDGQDETDNWLSGQVDVDTYSDVTRRLQGTLVALTGAPDLGSQVIASYNGTTVFTGVLISLSSVGSLVTIEAQGYDSMLIPPAVTNYTGTGWAKNSHCKDIINDLLDPTGLGPLTSSVTRKIRYKYYPGRWDAPWDLCQGLADTINRQLFFDAEGTPILRKWPTTSVHTFTTDELLSEPQISQDHKDFINMFVVRWTDPCGVAHEKIRGSGTPDAPSYGARGLVVDLDDCDDDTDAGNRLDDLEDAATVQRVNAEFTCIPYPGLQEGDVITVNDIDMRLRTFSIPLDSGTMSIGTFREYGSQDPLLRWPNPNGPAQPLGRTWDKAKGVYH